jgi:selenide,water dikinase
LSKLAAGDDRVLIGPETADDAGVYRFEGTGLVATVDLITPVCDDARRFGRVAAANSLSDIFAMGGQALFALNICCFPSKKVPEGVLGEILQGAAEAVAESGAVILGGHSVDDDELKFGLAAIGQADPDRLLTNAGARAGDRLILTKPLGTGVLINAFKGDKLDEAGLEPALEQMERLNSNAARLAIEFGAEGATDITGFGLAGHALEIAKASDVGIRIVFADLPVYSSFYELHSKGVTTMSTCKNEDYVTPELEVETDLDKAQQELLFDPQTSGGLLIAAPAEQAEGLLAALLDSGHTAAEVGEVVEGPARLVVE